MAVMHHHSEALQHNGVEPLSVPGSHAEHAAIDAAAGLRPR
jgi:hypothetical protein